ncbi:CARDB domain-containing protein [Halorubrum sp. CBA1125]|uniref:PKD domain-containing protein n=1 Tax=Halorubrum sp. CBA1125 TaxID=2668072 RepID=UPI0031B7049C
MDDDESDSSPLTITVEQPDPNQDPVADAGDDQTVDADTEVTLDASGSSDPDDDSLSYSWSETTDSGVSLSDASAEQPTFTAPDVDSETTLEFQLEVTDDDGASDTDTVSVTVQPPDAANFQVSNLDAPSAATQGDEIDVSADVENTGEQSATKSVEFRVDTNDDDSIGDESAVDSQDIELNPGESTTVTFEDVDTSGLPVGTLTHGVTTPDDSATAQITIDDAPPTGDKETTVSLDPASQTGAVGATTTYDVVVDNADGGVGAGELAATVDDTSVATITGVNVLNGATADIDVTDSSAEFDYFGAGTADTGPVTVAEVTVEGAGDGTTSLSIGPASGNGDVLLFDEGGNPYDVTGTNGASLEVLPVEFLVDSTSAPEKAAVGSTATVTATVSSDGDVESTQSVELLFDIDGDGDLESVETKEVTLDANGQTQVSFDVAVPADASFGDRAYSVETAADSAGGTVEFTPPAVNDQQGLPGDPDGDGLYEDVNGDGNVDSGDAQSLFANREGDIVQNNFPAFDFNGDGQVNVGDAQVLFSEVTG